MDMLTKIIFEMYNKDNFIVSKIEIPICEDTEEIDIVQCREYYRIDISLFSDDDNACIKVFSVEDSLEDKDIIIYNNETKTICDFKNYDNKLVPGYYCYRVYLSGRELDALYFIKPSSVDWRGLTNLRNFLNSYISGLALNMYIQRKTNMFKKDDLLPPNVQSIYLYLYNNKDMLINNLRQIIQNPIQDIKQEYKENHYPSNLDNKSQKWLATKGLLKNANIYMPELVYSKHSIINIDTLENKWVKKIIKSIIYSIFNVENSMYIKIKQVKEKIENKQKRIKKLKKECDTLDQAINASEGRKLEIKTELGYLPHDIEDLNEKLDLIYENLLEMKKLKALLISLNNETWLANICDEEKVIKPTIRLFKDHRYYVLYDFYMNIQNLDKIESKFKDVRFSYKDTPTLFEYYAVMLTLEILKDMGFIWIEGWLADDISVGMYNVIIPTGEPFVFLNESKDIRVELYYEKEIRSDFEVMNNNISDFIRGASYHYKPDILLAIFDNNTDQLLNAMIIEVKCYKSKYLVMEESNLPSKVIEQVRSYSKIEYYDVNKEEGNKANEAIDRVIVVYPKQDHPEEYPYDDRDIKFIQIEAGTEEVYKHYGYNELKNEIEQVLKKRRNW